jgi:flagellar FliL protein
MSDNENDPGEAAAPRKKSRLLLVACAAALLAGGGGFLAVRMGLLDLFSPNKESRAESHAAAGGEQRSGDAGYAAQGSGTGPAAFVLLDPLVISLGPESRSKHLKVTLAIDVERGREPELEAYIPRVNDILQGFLRAVDEREFEIPRSMERLRAQMLRRVQLVTPPGAARDLLIQEFVLN